MSAASSFLIGMLIFIGLPLLGWGLMDIAGFLAHPARALYTVATVLLGAWFVARLPNAGRGGGRGKRTVERQHIALVLLQVLSLALVVMAPYCDRRGIVMIPGTDGVRYLGLAAYVGGSILMNVAALALGRQFSTEVTIQSEHRLVTEGPYRLIRHPRYTGVLVFMVGISLVFRSWIGLLLVLLTAAVLAWRIRDEEALMKEEFSQEWDLYASTTWRMIPYVY